MKKPIHSNFNSSLPLYANDQSDADVEVFNNYQTAITTSTSTPPRFKKHSNRKQYRRLRRQSNNKQASESSSSDSIDLSSSFSSSSSSSLWNKEHINHLKRLDNHPALLLNADYQVRLRLTTYAFKRKIFPKLISLNFFYFFYFSKTFMCTFHYIISFHSISYSQ